MQNCLDQMRDNAENWWGGLYYHVLPALILQNNFRKGIEIGVAFGGHAESMLKTNCLDKLVCIDPWEWTGAEFGCLKNGDDFDAWHRYVADRLAPYKDIVDVVRSKSKDFATKEKFDFVFIDGDHSYEAVKADIAKYRKFISKGGWLMGHDYGHPDFDGVKRAVDEYVAKSGKELCVHDGYVWSIIL